MADAKSSPVVSTKDLIEAVAALDKAEELLGQSQPDAQQAGEIHIRLAKMTFLISEDTGDKTEKLGWLNKGLSAAEAAARERPDRVEGYYYQAVILGRRAELGALSAMVELRKMLDLGLKAEQIDPGYWNAAPLNFLAMLYAKAPSWPTGIGDVDLGLRYAEKALAASEYPLNHLIFAEVLLEAGEKDQARKELATVLAAPPEGLWAWEGKRWCQRAKQLLAELDTP